MAKIKEDWAENIGKMIEDAGDCPLYFDLECPNETLDCAECLEIFIKQLKEQKNG